MIGGGYGYGSVFGNGNLPPAYGPYFGGNPYASTPYSAYRPPSNYYFDPYSNPALQESMLENQLRWGQNLPPNGVPQRMHVRLRPSTPEQQAKSIHFQAQGDVYLHRLKFLNAYERYKAAVNAANDRPEPISAWATPWRRSAASTRPSSTSNRGSTSIQPGPRTANGWRQSSATTIGSPS